VLAKKIRCIKGWAVDIETRPISILPGGSAESIVFIQESGARVIVYANPSDSRMQVVNIDPVSGRTPLQVRMIISISPSARPGIYSVDIAVLDAKEGRVLASSRLPVIVVDSPISVGVLETVDKLRKIYKEKGVQYTIVYVLNKLGVGVRFSDIKLLYELIVGRKVSNGTVEDLLKRLVKKGILKQVGNYYYLSVDLKVAMTVMDLKRARNGLRGALKTLYEKSDRKSSKLEECQKLPTPVKKVVKIVRELLEKDYWMAVDFIAHTLISVKKTGTWILWFDDYFVYHENKTGLLHYFRSQKLSSIFRELGLKPGVMKEHEHHPCEKHILEHYGSHTNVRRIHYLLRELG